MRAQRLSLLVLVVGVGFVLALITTARAEPGEGALVTSIAGETIRARDNWEHNALGSGPQVGFTRVFTSYLPVIQASHHHALMFDGNDDYVHIADAGFFDFADAFSVEVWVKPLSVTAQWDNRGIVTGQTTGVPTLHPRWGIEQGHSTYARWYFWVCAEGGQPSCKAPMPELEIGEWQHLAGTYDGSRIWTYHDGQPVSSVSYSGDVTDVNFMYLGRSELSFHGVIDEVRIWNVTRSPAEVQANMNRKLDGNEPGLVGYWRLDEGGGQAVSDATGNSSDGWLGSSSAGGSDDPLWVVSGAPVW
jgi:hypothetical protein